MANVRIDQNGIPMGPAYEPLAPVAHRSGVTVVDASDPGDTTGAVDCSSFQECRFDITITGTAITSLEVALLFWNPRQSLWFQGDSRTFASTGRHALAVDVRGSTVFLKVVAFSGTSFSLDADYILS